MARWLALLSAAAASELSVLVDDHCGYAVHLDGSPWLEGGQVRLAQRRLSCAKTGKGEATDALGPYRYETLSWSHGEEVVLETSFRSYGSFVVFEQLFPKDLDLEAKPWGSELQRPHSLFPAFGTAKDSKDLDCFAYHGVFPSLKRCKLSSYAPSHQGGAPLVIYNASTSPARMTVFSPLNQPKAQQMFAEDGIFGGGVKGTVKRVPAGWRQLYLLSAAEGILDGMMSWGDIMLKFTGKPRADMYGDDVLGSIGFWTDNGGYYHYATGSNETYEEVLPKVKAYHESLKIPFKHWQFDSWFYPKDGSVDPGGGGGAVTNWTALSSVFPSGMAKIQSKLRVPMAMHNRQWSPHSDYVKHEAFKWYTSKTAAVPVDPEAFFRWFFTQQQGWGLAMYEQDWMCTEYDTVEALQTNVSLADLWLEGMAKGAASRGLTVQYCMPYPYDVLAAASHPAVTNARATDDYIRRDTQWAIGATSMPLGPMLQIPPGILKVLACAPVQVPSSRFPSDPLRCWEESLLRFYWALGILPFKDGFYSSTLPQRGGQIVGPEEKPNRAALMAALSTATAGPMDGINLMNASRVMSLCRSDGRVLKPDRPVMPLESCFAQDVDPASCFKYSTYSELLGLGRVFYIFMDQPGPVAISEVAPAGSYVLYDWYSSEVIQLDKTFSLSKGYEGHGYGLLIPVVYGWSLLGEMGKLVPTSSLRFPHLAASEDLLQVTLRGVKAEVLQICAAKAGQKMCRTVRFAEDGLQTVHFSRFSLATFV